MQPVFPSVDAMVDVLPLPSAASALGNIACATPEVTPRSAATHTQTARQIQTRGKSSQSDMTKSSGTEQGLYFSLDRAVVTWQTGDSDPILLTWRLIYDVDLLV